MWGKLYRNRHLGTHSGLKNLKVFRAFARVQIRWGPPISSWFRAHVSAATLKFIELCGRPSCRKRFRVRSSPTASWQVRLLPGFGSIHRKQVGP